jgi:hypothetical protein
LDTITVTAADGADVTLGAVDAAGASLTSVTLTASTTGSVITATGLGLDGSNVTAISAISASAVSGATVDIQNAEVTTIGSVTFTGAGTFNFDGADMDITTLERVSLSGSSGTNTVDLTSLTSATSLLAGTGALTYNQSSGADTVTLIASDGTDALVMHDSAAGTANLSIYNFQNAGGGDALDISITGINGLDLGGSVGTLTDLDAGGTDSTGAIVIATTTTTYDMDSNATGNHNILNINADVADLATLKTAIATGGTHEITVGAGTFDDDDTILVLWDDGVDSYLTAVQNDSNASIANGAKLATAGIELETVATFYGVSDSSTFTAADLGTTLIA